MATKRHSIEVKTYAIQRLAMFDSPSTVVEACRNEFGIDVPRQTIESLDPTKRSGKGLAKKWMKLFEVTRAKFLEDTCSIAVSHKTVRLHRLQRLADRAESMGNITLAASLLEQAAKEMGDAYTNRRKFDLSNPDGSLAPTPVVVVDESAVAEAVKALTG